MTTNKIMELADAYVNACVADKGTTSYGSVPTAHRATLQAEVELLLEQNKQLREQNDSVGEACAKLEAELEEAKVDATIIAYHEATIARLTTGLAAAKADAERLDWLTQNFYSRENLDWLSGKPSQTTTMWVFFAPKGVQGYVRNVIDAAMKGQP